MKHVEEPYITLGRYVLLVVLAPLFLHPRHSTSQFSGWVWNKTETVALVVGWAVYGFLAYSIWTTDAVALLVVP